MNPHIYEAATVEGEPLSKCAFSSSSTRQCLMPPSLVPTNLVSLKLTFSRSASLRSALMGDAPALCFSRGAAAAFRSGLS
jgi:hypothetical protein